MLTTILMPKMNDVIVAKTIKMIRRKIILMKRFATRRNMYPTATIQGRVKSRKILAAESARLLGMMIFRLPCTGVLIRYSNRLEPSCT